MEQETNPVSEEKAKKRGGRLITKENAKQYQLSSAKAKALRKEARMKMLKALTEELDLGEELKKAMKSGDEKYLGMIEKATRLVGLTHDQSEDAVAQKLNIQADAKVKSDSKLEIVVKEA